MIRSDLRNIAIIAHVDHGKTTLVDEMLKQGGMFRENQVVAERVMDSNDLERERGITILAKNTSAFYKGIKINLIDTPGHADFSGEVERVLNMVDGVLLLVDAAEGPMPQTRFVLSRALELGHKIIIVVNKVDRPDARLDEIGNEVLELLLDLDANDEQLESPLLFCSGRSGTASLSQYEAGKDLTPLFETIVNYIEPPEGEEGLPLQMLVSSIDYNDYVGRVGIGRIERGSVKVNQNIMIGDYHESKKPYMAKITSLFQIEGLNRVPVQEAKVGDIVWISGIENVTIGDTICDSSNFEPIPFTKISEPTVEMTFSVNDSPFAGREGKYVTSRHLRDRLYKETLKDVSLRVSDTDTTDSFLVAGRGEMHLSILIENMRREGYELAVSTPRVLFREVDGNRYEPIEQVIIDVPEESVGVVMEKLGTRKGELQSMHPQGSRMRLEFLIPSRGLFGYKSEFLTDTKGEGIMNSVFSGYQAYKGDIMRRNTGSLVSHETGEAVTYGLYNAQERGSLFIEPGTPVYEGMVVGASPKAEDLVVNVCKKKHLTNMRASGSDEALRLVPPKRLSLEECLEFLADDELLEVTPKSLRIRKRILSNVMRAKGRNK
ncbi:MAG: translational GTPase TypA [Clostridiales bacterium]|jgi:GTP-binding protein|nr:translational GTPase TypA [Clostridiales bacterium]